MLKFNISSTLRLVSKQSMSSENLSWYFVLRIFKRSMVNRMLSRYFLEYQQSSRNIIRCQVPSRVRAWFHDSAGDIEFYQMSLSQSESDILHESIIYQNIGYQVSSSN